MSPPSPANRSDFANAGGASATPERQHRARRVTHHMLCRRAKEQQIGRSTPLHAHDDQIALSFSGDPQISRQGLPCVISDSTLQNSGTFATVV